MINIFLPNQYKFVRVCIAWVEHAYSKRRDAIHVWNLLFIAIFLVYSSAANASPCDPASNVRKVFVHDFHAVGDGKTDDGPAIRAALRSAIEGPKPVSLEFDPGKVYRITSFEDTYALRILNAKKISLHGNGAELLLLPPYKVLRLAESSDVSVCSLTVDYSPLPFTQGTVVSASSTDGTFILEIDPGFDVPKVDDDSVGDNESAWAFAMPYEQPGIFEKRVNIKTVHAASKPRQVTIVPSDSSQVQRLSPNQTHLVMAMPGKGQVGNFAFQILDNERVYMQGIRVYAVPQYTFYVANNQDSVKFVDVEQRPRPGTSRVMSGWRDVFHVKDNRTPIHWDGCYIDGAFDDAFNLSAMYQLVIEKLGPNKWRLRDLGRDGAPIFKAGDRLQATDLMPDRKLIGETTIASVTQNGAESIVTVSSPLPITAGQDTCSGIGEACGSRVVNLDAANEGSVIRNCTIFGSIRLRSKATLERSKLDGFLQITSTPAKEGPLPNGVVVQDSELSGNVRIGADVNTKQGWNYGERWAQNLLFRNNRISSVFRAEGASFSLINNDIAWPPNRKFELKNSGPISIRNLTTNGAKVVTPLSRISIGQNMTIEDIGVK